MSGLDLEVQRHEPLDKGGAPFGGPSEEEEGEAPQRAHGPKFKRRLIEIHKDGVDISFGNETGIEAHGLDTFLDFGIWAVR